MRIKQVIFIISALLICSFLFFETSCNKDSGPDPDVNDLVLTVDKTNITPYEIVTITAEDYIFTSDIYSASIETKDIELVKSEESKLVFMMPNISEGKQTLIIHIDEKEYNIDFTIIALDVIDNPTTVIDDYKQNIDNALDTILYLYTLPGTSIPEQNIELIQEYLNDFDQAYANASETEKQELAQFMNVNSELFNFSDFYYQLNDSLFIGKTYIKWDKLLTKDSKNFVALVIVTGVTIYAFDGLMIAGGGLPALAAGLALLAEFYMVLEQGEKVLNSSYKPFALSIINTTNSKASLTFSNDKISFIQIDASYRSLYNADLGQGTSSIVNDLASSMNTFLGYWNRAVSLIPGLDGTVSTLETQNTYLTNPNTSSVSSEYITIDNITNPNVTIEEFSNTNGISVSFTTNETENQDFSFDIIYTNPNFSIETETVSATLVVDSHPYSIEMISGNNQTGNVDTQLDLPLKVQVKDQEGNAFEGCTVYFDINSGGGTVANSSIVTDANGYAQTYWTLGSTEGEQTVDCYAFKSDGTTYVQNAPITFTATAKEITPYSITMISGNNQTGNIETQLSSPLKVQVKNEDGNAFEGCTVYFHITNGEGTLSNYNINTDANGFAQTYWTLGNIEGEQTVECYAFKSDGITYVQNAPITFTATAEVVIETFTDSRDGQVYKMVTIGSQIWMAENLNYQTTNSYWYDNSSANGDIYGRLYTMDDALTACPSSWHLPTDDEWKELELFLGMSSGEVDLSGYRNSGYVGSQLKSNTGWTYNGSNSVGFTALPNGYYHYTPLFSELGEEAYFWSSTNTNISDSYWTRNIETLGISRVAYRNIYFGFSVRCIKD